MNCSDYCYLRSVLSDPDLLEYCSAADFNEEVVHFRSLFDRYVYGNVNVFVLKDNPHIKYFKILVK